MLKGYRTQAACSCGCIYWLSSACRERLELLFFSGVVGAVGNNGVGVTGVNQAISIISCKFMDATGNGWVSDAIQCIDYCISKDAHIMSNSWGGVAYSQSLQVGSTNTIWQVAKPCNLSDCFVTGHRRSAVDNLQICATFGT